MFGSNRSGQRADATKRERLWSPDFVILLGVSLCAFLSCQGLNNGSALYVAKLGGSVALAGSLITTFSFAAAITRIILGRLLDRGICRHFIIFGAVCFFIGTAGAIVFPGIEPQFVLRALQGIGFSCTTTSASKAAAEVLPQARLGEGVGYFSLGQSLGMAIGPPTVVALCDFPQAEAQFIGFSFFTAVLILLAALSRYENRAEKLPETSAYRMRAERKARGESDPQEASTANLPLLKSLFVKSALHGAIPTLFACSVNALVTAFVALYGTQMGVANPGLLFLFMAMTMTIIRLFGGAFFDKVKPKILFIPPVLCGLISLGILVFWPTQVGFLVAGVFFGVNMGIALPLLNSVCVKCTLPERWGSASAMYLLAMDIGVGVSSIIWGAITDAAGYQTACLVGACLLVFTYFVAFITFPNDFAPRGK